MNIRLALDSITYIFITSHLGGNSLLSTSAVQSGEQSALVALGDHISLDSVWERYQHMYSSFGISFSTYGMHTRSPAKGRRHARDGGFLFLLRRDFDCSLN